MNIRDVNTGTYRPDQLRNGSVGESGKVENGAAARSDNEGSSSASKDRVEISANGRASARDTSVQDLAFARKAMLGIPPLSDDRVADILMRIQEGYYSQPEVLKKIAERFTEELTGGL
jgi:hypothetical protein